MEKATMTPRWKNRLGFGRKSKANLVLNHTPLPPPEEPDSGEGRSLATKRAQRIAAKPDKKLGGTMIRKLHVKTSFRKESRDASDSSPSNPQSPYSNDSVLTVESDLEEKKQDYGDIDPKRLKQMIEQRNQEIIYQKQQLKERDGFCRRVDAYDGNVIVVDQKPTYEIGNYLGGGVAGVVYQGHRLRPLKEYPIRAGINDKDDEAAHEASRAAAIENEPSTDEDAGVFYCGPVHFETAVVEQSMCGDEVEREQETIHSPVSTVIDTTRTTITSVQDASQGIFQEPADVAIETTMTQNESVVMLDAQDAPSRSKHFSLAAGVNVHSAAARPQNLAHGLTDEAVAIKILNPVGYRILQSDGLKGSVIVKKGEAMDADVKKGLKPMSSKHVWWMVNPNSRNLRTLQRYNNKDKSSAAKTIQVDRGSAEKGLRLSLIAAYVDPRSNQLRELTLTRCIEIWGHIPFGASDVEFEDMMAAIDRVNAGLAPPSIAALDTSRTDDQEDDTYQGRDGTEGSTHDPLSPVAFQAARTGLLRAALTPRQTVYCEELNAYIAIPCVPTKYLRWLRQRRAATKEVRNMMLIGRHKNVLHLFEVLEFIQESKSTMFLILELVKGGELFDLISSSSGKNRKRSEDIDEVEETMRKFFFELASGINYCHKNGIAHRDLKPENLLVHNGAHGEATLKIADFGLSAAFGPNSRPQTSSSDNETLHESLGSPLSQVSLDGESTITPKGSESAMSPSSQASTSSMKESMDKLIASGAHALSFLTCGAMEGVLCIPSANVLADGPPSLRRMTSVVGSPHYVAPEIISQNEEKMTKRGKSLRGYDGAKADVWSAGVILYAMLFRSLPFGEDLLRCPRYQSYRKWYDEVRELGGRRSSATAALNPNITGADERDFLGPHWFFPGATSKESRDLIVAMLNPKPEDRLSVAQVLEHPWVKMLSSREC